MLFLGVILPLHNKPSAIVNLAIPGAGSTSAAVLEQCSWQIRWALFGIEFCKTRSNLNKIHIIPHTEKTDVAKEGATTQRYTGPRYKVRGQLNRMTLKTMTKSISHCAWQ